MSDYLDAVEREIGSVSQRIYDSMVIEWRTLKRREHTHSDYLGERYYQSVAHLIACLSVLP